MSDAHAPRADSLITLGVEEELQVVDAAGALAAHDFARGLAEHPDRGGASSRELHRCVLEIKSPVCRSADAAVAALAGMRALAAARARAQGQRVLAAGVHPFSRWREQPLWEDPAEFPRFARLVRDHGDRVRGALAFGLHVHLGCGDPALRMPAMNALRNVLPEVLALTASSPLHDGRDTGLASWRQAILARLPRSGIPAAWPDEAAYSQHLQRLRGAGALHADEGLWEDLRLHHRFGTLEVRIADAVAPLERVWLVVALLQAELATLEQALRAGREPVPLARELIEENKRRAARHGLDAELVDWAAQAARPMHETLARWLARIAPAATRLGTLARLEEGLAQALREGAPAQAQLARLREGTLADVVDQLVADTARPASRPAQPALA